MHNKRARSEGRVLRRGLLGQARLPRKGRSRVAPSSRKVPPFASSDEKEKLLARLNAAEDTLRALQSGEVDALMVSGHRGPQVVTLKGGEPSYRLLVEAMSEGAATLSRNGSVLYCNRRFADLICRPRGRVIGIAVRSLLAETERSRFDALLKKAQKGDAKGEFSLRRKGASPLPVYLSLNRFRGYEGHALGMVITDLSEQKRTQAADVEQAKALHRLLLERTFAAQEEERRRIARELHDEAGQLLTSLLVGLRTLEDSAKIANVRTQGHRLRKIAVQAMEEIGRLARGLHPAVLEDHGLDVALSRYLAEFEKTHNISARLTLDGLDSSRLPPAHQVRLYRILQEALTNVARHSKAKKVHIVFARSGGALEVTVADNGRGFDAKAVAESSRRLGIQSMRERAAMMGGTVDFMSQGKGTRVVVQIPLHGRDSRSSGGKV